MATYDDLDSFRELSWHATAAEDALARLSSSSKGLDEDVARKRLAEYGRNTLPAKKPPALWAILLHQFQSPLIYILLVAATVAVAIGDPTDAGFILAVVGLNAGVGTYQEYRAERSAAGLQRMLRVIARVRRGGSEKSIEGADLVPGDVVLLESGRRVPADLRLLSANGLDIDESFLTGESAAVRKTVEPVRRETPLGERTSLAFAGSTVMSGRGIGVVVATGLRTEVGKIASSVTETRATKPPLVLRMERFARQISLVVLAACALLALVALSRGMPWLDVFFLSVALAVSAIPEGLPMAMTVALSIATSRMAKRNVIVRKLTAVEGLGSCTIIASDKTGTLTVNRQTVRLLALPDGARFQVSGEGYAGAGEVTLEGGGPQPEVSVPLVKRLARAGVLCNEARLARAGGAWEYDGDAVDVALLALGYKLDLEPAAVHRAVEVTGTIPFESSRSFAATFYAEDGRERVALKGAIEVLLPRCRAMLTPEGSIDLDTARIEAQAVALSQSGHRFLAVCEGDLERHRHGDSRGEEDLPPLTFLGLVGLIDPPRPEAREAVEKCRRAGIEVAMVTGDHPLTALAIARELGIVDAKGKVVTGRDLERLGDPGSSVYEQATREARVFARVAPLQKLHIVEALQRGGHFVAVTGDGVNDAPALKKANIGVAMGSGTDVAKDTAALIVTDDNFASIEAGVEEGRFAYDNIRKVTYLLISCGAAEVLLFVLALLSDLPLPLLPVQILWLNLVTNGIQDVALAFEGGEPGSMSRPPRRPTEGIFNRLMVQQTVFSGVVMGLVVFANWFGLLGLGMSEFEARDRLLLLFVLLQNFHTFNCRSEHESAFRVPLARNRVLVLGVLGALGLHILAMHVPFMQRLLHVAPIQPMEWLVPVLMASSVLLAMEFFKWLRRQRVRT